MCSSQAIYRRQFAPLFLSLSFLLASITISQNSALGQQRIFSPEQPQQSHRLNLRFSGEQPRPLAMVSGDFDEDGVPDLVIGYGMEKGGSIALLRGNPDAIAPRTEASWLAAGRHEYIDPFIQRPKPISTKAPPNLMLSVDVNGDGHLDLVYAARGSSALHILFGTGQGTFLQQPVSIALPGGITALASYRPGMPLAGEAVIVGYRSGVSGRIGIVSYGATGLTMNASYTVPNAPTMLAVANLDTDFIPDTAIVAGGELLVLHGKNAIHGGGQLEVLPVNGAEAVTAGEFLFDRHAQMQLSVVTSSGRVVILAHQGFDPTPYTPQQIVAARHSKVPPSLAQQAGNTGNEPWVEVESHSEVILHPHGSVAPILLRSRQSGSGGDDLVVVDPAGEQRAVISHPATVPSPRSTLSSSFVRSGMMQPGVEGLSPSHVAVSNLSSGEVVAAIPMRVNADGRQGIVTLNASDPSPEISVPRAGNTFYVNVFTDNGGNSTDAPSAKRCTQGQPMSNPCTLRDAITYVNNDAADNINAGKSDTIMVPNGTYQLTWQAGTLDTNGNAVTHLEILGPVTIIGGTAAIIDGHLNDTVFTINPGLLGYYSTIGGSGASLAFNTTLENLTIENGKNANNPINSSTGLFNNASGGINWDAFGTGNLTLTNCTVQNNEITWGDGGGIWAENSAGGGSGTLTISGGSVSNNSTSESGGGIFIAFPASALTVSNTTITGNKASVTVNPGDPGGADGSDAGGGIFLTARSVSGTPQTTLSGLTISSNIANGAGGGINTGTGIVLTTSVLSSNSSTFATSTGQSENGDEYTGGGFWSNIVSPEVAPTITSTNFLNNSAYSAGGAIAQGTETTANGNNLQISLSRIFGNTSTNGASGLALGQQNATGAFGGTVTALNNWWGCNAGPLISGDGCDQAAEYPIGTASGTLTVAPYAQFLLSATPPTTIPIGSSIGLNLSLNTNSNSQSITGAFPAVSNTNYTYSFTVSGVTADSIPAGTFSTGGIGAATLTPTSTGSGTVSATFDNQTDSVPFTLPAVSTSLAITSTPSTIFVYGQPSSFTVQLTPGNATGITTSDFTVTVDGSSVGYGLTLISNNNYQLTGPFNSIPPGVNHMLKVSFAGTASVAATSTSVNLTVSPGSVTIGDTITPPKPVQGQGGTINVTATQVGTGAQPTGSLSYAFDGWSSTAVSLVAGAAAVSIPTTIPTGGHIVKLTYNGDTNYSTATINVSFNVDARSQTTIAAITSTTATINVFGFGFTAPSGQLAFTDSTQGNPVAAPVTLNTSTAATSLLPQVTTSTGAKTLPDWTTLGDINGDGKQDLVTSLYNTDSVSVQLGNGDGTFQPATTTLISAGFGPAECHLVSLRGNGTLDLIVGSFNLNEIAVLLGNGNGTFQDPVFYTVGTATNTPTSLTTGDFNRDGKLDVALANTGNNTVSIFLGDGTGALTPLGSPINVGRIPQAIRAGDFNDDGYSDLAVANYSDGTVTTLLNNQNGTFTSNTIGVGSGAGSGPQALAIDGAGASLLLAVANYKDNTVSVMQSQGNGNFGAQTIIPVGMGPDDVNFADFNGDGLPDLVVSNYTSGSVNLMLKKLAGGYSVLGPFKVGNNPYSAAVGDLDLDGTPDIVVSNCFSDNTGVLLSGTQISVPYTGLSFTPGQMLNATYTPGGASNHGSSTSPNVTAP